MRGKTHTATANGRRLTSNAVDLRAAFGKNHEADRLRLVLPAEQVFRLVNASKNAGYKAIREGTFPLQAIHIGRRIVFARTAVRELLGLGDEEFASLLQQD